MKKLLTALLSLVLITALLSASLAATSTVTGIGSYAALISAANGIALPDAPQGATDVQYSLIHGDKPIAQIRFTLDGVTYHLRARSCADAESVGDLSGMMALFGADGLQQTLGANGAYQLALKGKNGLAQWYSEAKLCEYALLADGAADEATFKAFAEQLQANAAKVEAVHEKGTAVEGTVKKISKKSLTLTAADGASYTFSIGKSTVNPDAKKVKKGVIVRVNFSGDYAKGCEAISITLVSGGKGGKATPKPTKTPNPSKQYKLDGVVTMLAGNLFEVQSSKGARETFLIEDAKVTGGGSVEVGDKASVVYNYQNNSLHLISVKFTHVEPTPTPGPQKHTMKGTISYRDADTLILDPSSLSGDYSFEITNAKKKGDLDADVGDDASVTYYEDEFGNLIATQVVFTKFDPEPIIDPVIDDDPVYDDESAFNAPDGE